MVRTTFALILYFHLKAHKAACHTLSKIFYNEDMVQIWLTLEKLFTQGSKVERLEICSVLLLPAVNPACSSAIISSAWGLVCSR